MTILLMLNLTVDEMIGKENLLMLNYQDINIGTN